MILAGAEAPAGKLVNTPVSLVDVYPTILEGVGAPAVDKDLPGCSLFGLLKEPDDRTRIVFSEYHAAGSPSASYMLRKGRFKFIYYVGYTPELFDLEVDPEETRNLAGEPEYAATARDLETELRKIVDPEKEDARANEAQRKLIESRGGPEEVLAKLAMKKLYTPVPDGTIS